MTSATEVLRRMLDERGVEWWQKKRHTCWKVSKGQEVEMWRAWEAPDGSLTLKVDYIYGLTPEQAISATLGAGTCKRVFYEPTGVYVCSECGRGLSMPIALDESAWVKLPKDADNVPIHAGDVLDGYGKTIEVVELRYGRSGWVLISRDGNGYADTYAFSHRQPDSWERIIDDAEALAREWFNTDMSENEHADGLNALVARCKKLAGDAS